VNVGRRGSDTGHMGQRAPGPMERRGAPGGGNDGRNGYDDFYDRLNDDFFGRPNDDFYGSWNDDFYDCPPSGRGGRDRYDDGFHHQHKHEQGGFSCPKLNFPSFDGESDPLPWLTKCASYFHGMHTVEEMAWMAALHLEGAATKWYYALERDPLMATFL
jgi:hypothetical protein